MCLIRTTSMQAMLTYALFNKYSICTIVNIEETMYNSIFSANIYCIGLWKE